MRLASMLCAVLLGSSLAATIDIGEDQLFWSKPFCGD
jgi:hypothetical protein